MDFFLRKGYLNRLETRKKRRWVTSNGRKIVKK